METNNDRLEKVEKMELIKSNVLFYGLPKGGSGPVKGVFSPECLSTGTEGHHASHVLTFLSFMVYNAINGKSTKQHLFMRAIHHLEALQEFIETPELSALVKSMLKSIRMQYEMFSEDAEQPSEISRRWLLNNQQSILRLAACYKKESVFNGLLPIKVSVGSTEVTGTAIQGYREHHPAMDEQRQSMLFRGYFNNKMTLLVLLIQTKRYRPEGRSAQLACNFLDDMYRHMLPEGLQRQYRLVFIWLKKFFLKLPDVSHEQRCKASRFIYALYDVFGVSLNQGGRV